MQLFYFFKYILSTVEGVLQISALGTVENFSQSIQGCYSFIDLENKTLHFVSLLPFTVYYEHTFRILEIIKCPFVEFSNHAPSNALSITMYHYSVQSSAEKRGLKYKPHKIYCYYALKAALNIL